MNRWHKLARFKKAASFEARGSFSFIRLALDTPLLAAGRKERNGAAVGKRVRATIKECLF
ncbi:hypothetical protein B1R32_1071, partial [Abditibacterium utsteinense]